MHDKWKAVVEEFELPAKISIKSEGVYQEPEYTGEYMNRIVAELREQGRMFDMAVCAVTLRNILMDGERADNYISERLWKDEPIAAN